MRKIILFTFIIPLLGLYGCPHLVVESLEKKLVNQTKPVYITSSIQASKLIKLDSAKIKSAAQLAKNIDSLKANGFYLDSAQTNNTQTDSAQSDQLKIIFEIRSLEAKDYPEKIEIRALVYDTLRRYISGLANPHFSLPGNWRDYWKTVTDSCLGIKSNITDFQVEEIREKTSPPCAIAIALDHSPSMQQNRALILQDAVSRLLKVIKKGDYIAVVKFAGNTTIEVPLTDTSEVYRSKFKKDGLEGYGGGTAMYDGVAAALEELKKAPETHNKVVILFSDGMDNSSSATIDAVELQAKAISATIYTIAFGLGFTDVGPLEGLAKRTKGKFYHIISTKEFPYVFADIYISLNNYYKITYRPPECAGKHEAEVSLDLTALNSQLLNGKGYYDKSIFKVDDPVGTVTFMNIEFDFGKAVVKKESYPLIEQVAKSMESNQNLRIKICGHTDDVGAEDYNLRLSQERAEAVATELEKLGISKMRLETEGFGESKPLVPNDSEDNKKKNRRTEFIIIAK